MLDLLRYRRKCRFAFVVAALVCSALVGCSGSDNCDDFACYESCRSEGHLDGYCADGACRCVSDEDGGVPPRPCNGACDRREYTACSCSEADPCGWLDDGTCDLDACLEWDIPIFHDNADCDDDDDGLAQIIEHIVAQVFAPALIFGDGDEWTGRRSYWAVEVSASGSLSIFYALSYFVDGGDPWFGGWHYGDAEFIVLEITVTDESWIMERAFLSAHYGQGAWDSSEWVSGSGLEYDESDGLLHPYVWVAEGKHANYRSYFACDAGAMTADRCDEGRVELVEVVRERNLGNDIVPLIDEVRFNGASEFYWSNPGTQFCGWQVSSLSASARTDCAPASNSYARQLDDWLYGSLF